MTSRSLTRRSSKSTRSSSSCQPIKEGDKLYCDVWVHSIRQSFGADIIVTKNIVTNDKGEIVQETYTTLAGRSDGEGSGFNDGTA